MQVILRFHLNCLHLSVIALLLLIQLIFSFLKKCRLCIWPSNLPFLSFAVLGYNKLGRVSWLVFRLFNILLNFICSNSEMFLVDSKTLHCFTCLRTYSFCALVWRNCHVLFTSGLVRCLQLSWWEQIHTFMIESWSSLNIPRTKLLRSNECCMRLAIRNSLGKSTFPSLFFFFWC